MVPFPFVRVRWRVTIASVWQDKWCGDMALMDRFPSLYACSTHRDVTIASVLMRPDAGGPCEWNVTFGRDFNDWELDLVVEFFQLLASNTSTKEGPDGLRWKGRKDGVFASRSFYHLLIERSRVPFPWKGIWAVKAPPRVSFFIWTVTWGRILTCDNLMRRGYTMVGRCCLCCSDGETVDHLLLHCPSSHVLWSFLFRSFHVNWVIPRNVKELLFGWHNWFGKHHYDIWNLAPLCLMWIVWLERNSRTFEDVMCSTDQLLEKFASSLFDWLRVWGFSTANNVADFIVSLSSVSVSLYIL